MVSHASYIVPLEQREQDLLAVKEIKLHKNKECSTNIKLIIQFRLFQHQIENLFTTENHLQMW
jgi:hypothetical protein